MEQLKNVATQLKDKKADYYSTVYSTLVERMSKPPEHFRNYILSLLGDRDYEKVVETVAKIDKAFDKDLLPPLQLIRHTGPPHFSFPSNFCLLSRSFFPSQRFPYRNRFQAGFRQYDRSFRRGRIPCFHCGGFNHSPANCYQKRDFSRHSRRKQNNDYPDSKPKGE